MRVHRYPNGEYYLVTVRGGSNKHIPSKNLDARLLRKTFLVKYADGTKVTRGQISNEISSVPPELIGKRLRFRVEILGDGE